MQKHVEDSESDDESQMKKERRSRKNSNHVTDSDDEKAENSPSECFLNFVLMKYLLHIAVVIRFLFLVFRSEVDVE